MMKRLKKFAIGRVIHCVISNHPHLMMIKAACQAIHEANKDEDTDYRKSYA